MNSLASLAKLVIVEFLYLYLSIGTCQLARLLWTRTQTPNSHLLCNKIVKYKYIEIEKDLYRLIIVVHISYAHFFKLMKKIIPTNKLNASYKTQTGQEKWWIVQ